MVDKICGVHKLERFRIGVERRRRNNLPNEEDSKETHKERVKARKRNTKAVFALTMAFKKQKLQGMVHKAKTKEYPSGLAHLIANQLKDKYMPTDE